MIQNIVDRGKKMAIKEHLETGTAGLRLSTCWPRASTSSRRTRTCPTPPTPTTGPGSRARRASGSSTSARSSAARATSPAGRSTRPRTPASTCRTASRDGPVPLGGRAAAVRGARRRRVADGGGSNAGLGLVHERAAGHGHRGRVRHLGARAAAANPTAPVQPGGQRLGGGRGADAAAGPAGTTRRSRRCATRAASPTPARRYDHDDLDEDPGLANVILTNGARLYVDHAHPEYSTPEVTNPRDVVLWDKAGERVMAEASRRAATHPRQPADPALQEQHRQQGRLLRRRTRTT